MNKPTKKRSKKSSEKSRPYWLGKGWPSPVAVGFAQDEAAWNYLMKNRYNLPSEPYPSADGLCTTFTKGEEIDCIVTVNSPDSLNQLVGILAHEATHCYQKIRDWMKEKEPGAEFEAYTIGAITQGLMSCYIQTRGVPRAKAEG